MKKVTGLHDTMGDFYLNKNNYEKQIYFLMMVPIYWIIN
jgi:hypothetical protein